MSAETLRKAASLMRERAEAATPGPWLQEGANYGRGGRHVRAQHQSGWPLQGVAYNVSRRKDAEHIASWHPTVALAVADWLETVAMQVDSFSHGGRYAFDAGPDSPTNRALAVAHAYLGSES